jgi:uncharacterized protein YdhG (YjbR/CyaY superfamily)
MVRSAATTVDAYLAELPKDRNLALTRLRLLAKELLPSFTEGMQYGMIYFTGKAGESVGFASQKQYVAIYLGQEVLDLHRAALAEEDAAKGCLRFSDTSTINWHLVEVLIRDVDPSARPTTEVPPSRPRKAPASRTARTGRR